MSYFLPQTEGHLPYFLLYVSLQPPLPPNTHQNPSRNKISSQSPLDKRQRRPSYSRLLSPPSPNCTQAIQRSGASPSHWPPGPHIWHQEHLHGTHPGFRSLYYHKPSGLRSCHLHVRRGPVFVCFRVGGLSDGEDEGGYDSVHHCWGWSAVDGVAEGRVLGSIDPTLVGCFWGSKKDQGASIK